ncbi:MAG: PQQ-binding-like beta-propeller repeat protein [Pirellulaceae bacterium]
MPYRRIETLVSILILLLASVCFADDWAHWRGPSGNGVSLTADPPTTWSDTQNVKWKVPIPGKSSGSPVIWDQQVFVVTAVPTGKQTDNLPELEFKLLAFDRANGQLQWERSAVVATPHEGTHSTNSFASASPCTDGEHVYAHFGSRGLYCYTRDGELTWKRDFGHMTTRNSFGEGSSPTIEGDLILVPWDHEGPSFLYALDKRTGNEVWKAERDEPSCWATPMVVQWQGKKQVIMNGQTCARAYDLESGKELWHCAGQTQRPAASPVFDGTQVYVGSGFRGSFLAAFQLDGQGNIEGTKHVVWSVSRNTPDIASLLLSEGRLYYTKEKSAVLTCVEAATGKPFYSAKRVPELRTLYASPIAAGGHVYITDRDGTTVVIKDAEQFEVVSINSVGETVDATLAPVDNQLFIRGEQHLFCIEE